MASLYHASVIVTSDTCFKDPSKEESGQYVVKQLEDLDFNKVTKHIVEDDKAAIIDCIKSVLKDEKNALIITVGGTGLCPRDVTPEATSVFYDKVCTGITTALLMTSLRYSPHSALSRLTAGISGNCLIINFPGKLKACKECFCYLENILGHALEQVRFDAEAIRSTHLQQELQSVKREPMAVSDHSSNGNYIRYKPPAPIPHSPLIQLRPLTPEPQAIRLMDMAASDEDLKSEAPIVKAEQPQATVAAQAIDEKLMVENDNIGQSMVEKPVIESPYQQIEYSEALDIMRSLSHNVCQHIEKVTIDSLETVHKILGDVVAEDLYSTNLIPPFAVSTMDGYVVNVPSTKLISAISTVQATLVDDLQRFEESQRQTPGNFFCYQINTGGRVPERNFAVVPFEKTGPVSARKVVPIYEMKPNHHIRTPGSDVNEADVIKAGTILGPVELSIILSMDIKTLTVIKKPVIGVLSTGDEIVDFHSDLRKSPTSVIDVNGPLLTSLFKSKGYTIISFGIAKDNPGEIFLKVCTSLRHCDILLITGGASMGTKDYVKDTIMKIGGVIRFGRVNIKPGKPVALASLESEGKHKFIFSLPGNPVSAYITTIVLALPFIEHGIRNHFRNDLPLTLEAIGELITVKIESILDSSDGNSYNFDGRLEFVRAKLSPSRMKARGLLNEPHMVTVSLKQQSSRMLSLKDCDCLIMIDPNQKNSKFLVGQTYPALRLSR